MLIASLSLPQILFFLLKLQFTFFEKFIKNYFIEPNYTIRIPVKTLFVISDFQINIKIYGYGSVVENEQKEGKGKFAPTMY